MSKRKMPKNQSDAIPKWKHFLDIPTQPMPEMGMTPKIAVWKKNKSTLWYYPSVQKKYNVPVFLIYSLINTPLILDLSPGNSLIESYVNEGFDVYLLDFGSPGYEDGEISIEDYVVDYIQKGVQRALLHSGASEITVMGFCLGGTIAAIYAAMADEPVKNLILSVTPIDFSASPFFDQWQEAIKEGTADFDETIDIFQTIPASAVQYGIRLMTSPIYISPYLSLLNEADNEEYVQNWRRFNAWTNGHVPLSGAAAKQITKDLVIKNRLVNGGFKVKGKKAKLSKIDANVLVLANKNDRLVPQEMIYPIMEHLTCKDKTYSLLKSGHAAKQYSGGLPPYLKDWLPKRSSPIQ
ncbi:Poly(3-hydroxyalkanoate) polymerase subunit PhaC [Peribacillus sp. Bi96]|uniref:alpha/beta fold hydrolase n=1 Tax=unclassified Peribacillus TaxID=2675266 RepID=UPI001E151EF5|nr:alpha/beta fold hydrolase [Peribacillus sp. Bi96]CAH0147449.1 Poly(3-hydroxyalkanoate) polymerase subunit PhaC [Peribacillus sp. Bi96]